MPEKQLKLMQLADSAVPIGGIAHSFGLETMVADGMLTPHNVEIFLADALHENGLVEGVCCRLAYRSAYAGLPGEFLNVWQELNVAVAALKPARESRVASATLGVRLLRLALDLDAREPLALAHRVARDTGAQVFHGPVFGLIGGAWELGEELTVAAFLQHSWAGLISATQRLMPVGQSQAANMAWRLRAVLLKVVRASAEVVACPDPLDSLSVFSPTLELASMRHPYLPVRLFIS